jgi:lipopolysaccharide export system protein LptC
MPYKNTIIQLVLVVIVVLTAWTTLSYQPGNTTNKIHRPLPDAFMEDVVAIVMDKQGKPLLKIVTPKMAYFSTKDSSHLIDPVLTIYRKSPQPWFITSKFAETSYGIDNLDFSEDVTIHHSADQQSPATLIKTPKLRVNLNEQTAETKEPITLTQPNLIVTATGMQADINSGDIKLLSEARGEYVPNS